MEMPVEVSFAKRVDIQSNKIFIGDLIEKCKGLDNACAIIEHIEVGEAPEIGKSTSLSPLVLSKKLI